MINFSFTTVQTHLLTRRCDFVPSRPYSRPESPPSGRYSPTSTGLAGRARPGWSCSGPPTSRSHSSRAGRRRWDSFPAVEQSTEKYPLKMSHLGINVASIRMPAAHSTTYRHFGRGMVNENQFRLLAAQQHRHRLLAGLVICGTERNGSNGRPKQENAKR